MHFAKKVTTSDGKVLSFATQATGNNGLFKLPVNVKDTVMLKVVFPGSGAVADLQYTMCSSKSFPTSAPVSAPVKVISNGTVPEDLKPKRSPTRSPTRSPSESPVRSPTIAPTRAPTKVVVKTPVANPLAAPTAIRANPTAKPTSAPALAPTGQCPMTTLDFEELREGEYITNQLLDKYGISVEAYSDNGGYTPNGAARVFNTSHPGTDSDGDADLGSPNKDCPGGGPGEGSGGAPSSMYSNCVPLGNVLIVQEENKVQPDDNGRGGTLKFLFASPTEVATIAILDIDDNGRSPTVEVSV